MFSLNNSSLEDNFRETFVFRNFSNRQIVAAMLSATHPQNENLFDDKFTIIASVLSKKSR